MPMIIVATTRRRISIANGTMAGNIPAARLADVPRQDGGDAVTAGEEDGSNIKVEVEEDGRGAEDDVKPETVEVRMKGYPVLLAVGAATIAIEQEICLLLCNRVSVCITCHIPSLDRQPNTLM